MTPAEHKLFDNVKREAERVFGPECKVYYNSAPDEFGDYKCLVMDNFRLETEGPELHLSLATMLLVLSKLSAK